jgi:hypothetical protein
MKRQLALFLILLVIAQVSSHPGCGVHLLKPNSQIVDQGLDQATTESLRKTDASQTKFESLRVTFDFSLVGTSSELNNMRTVLNNNVRTVIASLIKVKRQTTYKIDSKCADYNVPTTYTSGNYKDADLVILVRIDTTGDYERLKLEAAAVHCQQENVTNRPIVGHLTFKKGLFDGTLETARSDYMTWLALHELTHVLVFSESLYNFWPSTTRLGGIDNVIGKKTRPDGTEMKIVKTPKILQLGKTHFNCPDFDGLPLDYKGGQGTSGSHWSKRYMNTDYMIGDSYGENLISPLTLAMFEDSDWYQPNYNMANLFVWGKNQGCDFLNPNVKCASANTKNDGISSPFKNSFCTNPDQPVCSVGNVFRGNCKTKAENSIPESEQYFKNPNTAGADTLSDRCPIPIESKNQSTRFYGGSCRNGSSANINSFERVCPSCACFTGTIVYNDYRRAPEEKKSYPTSPSNALKKRKTETKQDEDEVWATYCLQYKCRAGANGQPATLSVVLLSKSRECPEGQTIEVDGFNGKLVCPPASTLCNPSYNCKFGCFNRYR